MSDKVLYYPNINVPKNDWFARVVLYWDEVGCILPPGYNPRPRGTTNWRAAMERWAFTNELIEAGLLRPVRPERAVEGIPSFVETFLQIIDTELDMRPAAAREGEATRIKVHAGKLGPFLIDELTRRGLALSPQRHASWIPVDPRTAELYVGYLAAQLGALEHYDMTPITDRSEHTSVFVSGGIPGEVSTRALFLNRVLPSPVMTDPHLIVRFKTDHHDQLVAFRRRLEKEMLIACSYDDPAIREEVAERGAAELSEERDELIAKMHHYDMSAVGAGTLGVVIAASTVAEAASTGHNAIAATSVAGLALAIRRARKDLSKSGLADSPLAYAALAATKLG
jgi:hypothetical protein